MSAETLRKLIRQGVMAEQELLVAETHAALREAFRQLPPRCRQLITLLTEDPPMPYAEISARLGIPVGSIGPTRRRCLDKLRRHPAITALINTGTGTAPADSPEALGYLAPGDTFLTGAPSWPRWPGPLSGGCRRPSPAR